MGKRPRIAVVGSANVDLTTFADRFPKPGETIFGQKFDLGFGGKGANQAVAARLCGAEVFMVLELAMICLARQRSRILNNWVSMLPTCDRSPGIERSGAIFVDPSGQNRIIVVKGANDELRPADVDAAADILKSADCIVLNSRSRWRRFTTPYNLRAETASDAF